MSSQPNAAVTPTAGNKATAANDTRHHPRPGRVLLMTMNLIVLILSVMLIVWISIDTFETKQFLNNKPYMAFQFWVCIFFLIDFFVGLVYADNKWRYFLHRFVFLILSLPVLNFVHWMQIPLSHDALYFVRFIPLARGALALSIVMGYLSSNAVTSLFMSYLSIMILICYFCSLIFYAREYGVNPEVKTYWTALWWSFMNLSTVGCDIPPMTVSGKIVAVVLPICGMIIFPLFTVYLTNYVTNAMNRSHKEAPDI